MTGLRRWRKVTKNLIIFFFAWEVAVTIVGLVLLILVAVGGGGTPSAERLISIVGAVGIYGVVIWAVWDARMRTRQQPAERVATAEEKA